MRDGVNELMNSKTVERRQPIPVKDAVQKVIERIVEMPIQEVALEKSLGYYLAEPIIAKHDVPSFNNSPYDGFAIRAEDSVGASGENRIEFTVIDHIGAGHVSNETLGAFEAVRIMTGAAIPKGANAVVMLEQTKQADKTFTIRKPFEPMENISLQGEDSKVGDELIAAGSVIHPGTIALLATFGYATVAVRKKPVVGVVCTGTELIDIDEPLEHGKIRNSNGPMIIAQLKRLGVEAVYYGTLSDDFEDCLDLVKNALTEVDCLITTGGVSVGDFDYLPKIYDALEADVLFNKVGMRPGSVTTVAAIESKLLFGLSGNPSACYSGFELFARPAILTMMGSRKPYLPHTKAVLQEDILKPNPFTRFLRSICTFDGGNLAVAPAGFNKSNAVSAIAKANALIVLPRGTKEFRAGDEVDVLLLGTEEGIGTWQL